MTGTVSYSLRSNGEEFPQAFRVKSILVLNEANRIPRSKIRLLDGDVASQDFPLSNTEFFKPGNTLEVDLGHGTQSNNIFKGIILKHAIKLGQSNKSYLEIECKHVAVAMTVSRKNRIFEDMTDKEALDEILEAVSFDHEINGMDEYIHQQMVQYYSTDWDFIMSRADNNGHLILFEQEKMTIAPPSVEGEDVFNCEFGANVLSFDGLVDGEALFSTVESNAWNPTDQQVVSGEGASSLQIEMGNLESATLADAINTDSCLLTHSGNISEDELNSWAGAKSSKMELSKIRGQVTVRGDHTLFPGMLVQLDGFGDRFTGKTLITGIRHEMSNGNWITSIQFGLPNSWFAQQRDLNALPSSGLLPAVSGIQVGVVTQLESDPANEFRIKVRLPILDKEGDGIWARLLKSYAGDGYGNVFHPEIGDEVMLGFINNDPREAIVLGSVHSSAKESPVLPADDNHEKGIISRNQIKIVINEESESITISTPGGREVTLNDQDEKIKISDPNGNFIEFSNDGISIESIKNLTIKAPMNIDMKGLNITTKADGKFAAEGSTGAEMKTGSIAVVKGSMVQIN